MIDESFEDLMGMLDSPVFVVTTQVGGQPSGCLVSFATRMSVQPPRFLVGLSRANHTFAVACRSEYLAVHVLARRQRALAALFGGQTGDQINKFERCSWRGGPGGMPILDDAVGWFVGRTLDRVEMGDHVGYLLEPAAVWAPECAEELLYLGDVDDLEPGHEVSHQSAQLQAGDFMRGAKFTLQWPS